MAPDIETEDIIDITDDQSTSCNGECSDRSFDVNSFIGFETNKFKEAISASLMSGMIQFVKDNITLPANNIDDDVKLSEDEYINMAMSQGFIPDYGVALVDNKIKVSYKLYKLHTVSVKDLNIGFSSSLDN